MIFSLLDCFDAKKGSKVQSKRVEMSVLSSSWRTRPGRLSAKGETADSLPDAGIFVRALRTAEYAHRVERIVWH